MLATLRFENPAARAAEFTAFRLLASSAWAVASDKLAPDALSEALTCAEDLAEVGFSESNALAAGFAESERAGESAWVAWLADRSSAWDPCAALLVRSAWLVWAVWAAVAFSAASLSVTPDAAADEPPATSPDADAEVLAAPDAFAAPDAAASPSPLAASGAAADALLFAVSDAPADAALDAAPDATAAAFPVPPDPPGAAAQAAVGTSEQASTIAKKIENTLRDALAETTGEDALNRAERKRS